MTVKNNLRRRFMCYLIAMQEMKTQLTLYVSIIAILDIWKTTLFYEGESVVYDGFKYEWPIKG